MSAVFAGNVPCALSRVAIILAAALTGAASAQIPGDPAAGREGVPVFVDQLSTLRVTPRGVIDELPPRPRACNFLSSHTDANFAGGSYVAQGGFAQGEILATSFVISAADFPIKIDLVECIFVTNGATVQTTTEWSILFWEGVPDGSPTYVFSSDDLILPHLRIGPGTAGTNIQFSVDPGDPEQIILNNDGSSTFSVGFRIDRHNSPPANPCLTAPPTCCNAFPVTDTSGLAQAANNWLFGLDCGVFGCPPNGGWARFSTLSQACRPSGDWVTRTTWSSVSCQPGIGPCCLNGACEVRTQAECQSLGGTYMGDGTSCSGVNCPPPSTQACCFPNGSCLNLAPADCTAAGGTSGGVGTACATFNCNPQGACCLPNGTCVGPVSPSQCSSQGGTYQGNDTSCATVNCPEPTGACCFSTGFCLVLTAADCASVGATWAGAGTTCADGNSNGTADACEAPACPGDLDGNSQVNISDLSILLSSFGLPGGASYEQGDLDGDGDVDISDLTLMLSSFGSTC